MTFSIFILGLLAGELYLFILKSGLGSNGLSKGFSLAEPLPEDCYSNRPLSLSPLMLDFFAYSSILYLVFGANVSLFELFVI